METASVTTTPVSAAATGQDWNTRQDNGKERGGG
jgi:hypothetical protein